MTEPNERERLLKDLDESAYILGSESTLELGAAVLRPIAAEIRRAIALLTASPEPVADEAFRAEYRRLLGKAASRLRLAREHELADEIQSLLGPRADTQERTK